VSQELPLGPILADGFANIKRVWTTSFVSFALVAILLIATNALPLDFYKRDTAGAIVFWGLFIVGGMSAVFVIMANGRAYRFAVTEAPPQNVWFRVLDLQAGSMEGRYLFSGILVNLLLIFYVVVVAFLVLVFAAIIAYGRGHELTMDGMSAIMNELGSAGAGAVTLVAILGMLGGVWLYIRVSLSQVASLYGDQVRVLSSASLTKGRVLALLPPLVVIGLLYGVDHLTATLLQRAGELSGLYRFILNFVSGVGAAFIQIPFSAGVFASIYQRLKPADKDESERPDSALGNGSNDGVFTD